MFFVFLFLSEKDNAKSNKSLYNSEMKKYRDDRNRVIASKKVSEINSLKELKGMKSDDEAVIKLQQELKRVKSFISSSFISLESNIKSSSKTVVTYDTIKGDSLYPVYTSSYDGEWYSWDVKASKDSTGNNMRFKEKLLCTPRMKRESILKKKELYVDVVSENPYSDILDVRSVSLKEKRPIVGIGPYIGVNINGSISAGIAVQIPLITIKK